MSTVRFTAEVMPDGTLRLPPNIKLEPGKAEVTVEQVQTPAAKKPEKSFVFQDLVRLAETIRCEGLPDDLALNHDHYIHGAEKGIDQS